MAGAGDRRWDQLALGAIGVGAVVRVVWVLILHPPLSYLQYDMLGYAERASRLASSGDLNRLDAFWPPGTHIILSLPMTVVGTGISGLWAGAVLWCVLSILTPYFMWKLARLLLNPAAACLTAVLTALYPLHVTLSGYFLSETPAMALLAGGLWLAYRAVAATGRARLALAAGGGLACGAAVANRPQFLLNVAVVALPLLWGQRRHLGAAGALAAGTGVVLAGIVAHNSVAAGRLTGLSENSGFVFYVGHCDMAVVTTSKGNAGLTIGSPVIQQRGVTRTATFTDHLAWDQGFFFRRGLDCVRADGPRHLQVLARNVFDMTLTTIPWPQAARADTRNVARASNVLYSAALPVIVIGSVVAIRRKRREGRPAWGEGHLLAHLACFVPTAMLFFGDPRFRTPYDLFGLALLAAVVVHFVTRRATTATPPAEPVDADTSRVDGAADRSVDGGALARSAP